MSALHKAKFVLTCYFVLLFLSSIAEAINREQIVEFARNWANTDNWEPLKDTELFGTNTFISNFRTKANGGNTPYNVEAYVYGGSDEEATYISRISAGFCPGGNNIAVDGYTTKWLYDNGYKPQEKLAGIDCSGFVSFCWNTPRSNTEGLANISLKLDNVNKLKPGDILNIVGTHVRLCISEASDGNISWAEATPPSIRILEDQPIPAGYTPYSIFPQFSGIYPPPNDTVE